MSCSGHNFAEIGRLRKRKMQSHSRTKSMKYINNKQLEEKNLTQKYILKKTDCGMMVLHWNLRTVPKSSHSQSFLCSIDGFYLWIGGCHRLTNRNTRIILVVKYFLVWKRQISDLFGKIIFHDILGHVFYFCP